MALDRQHQLVGGHAGPVIGDRDQLPAALVQGHPDLPEAASIAFSTSSLTAAAGRSTTSPAAIRFIRTGGSRRIVIAEVYRIRAGGTS